MTAGSAETPQAVRRTESTAFLDNCFRVRRILGLVSIAVTLYAVVTIYLSAGDAHAYQPVARSVYFQLIILLSVQTYRIDRLDFGVYREDTRTLRSPGKIID